MARESRLDFVKRELKRHHGKLKAVASGSKTPYTTVKNVAAGLVQDPRGSTLDRLYDYLQRAA